MMNRSRALRATIAIGLACLLAAPGLAAVGLNDSPETLQTESSVEGLAFAMVGRLPPAPASARSPADFCRHYRVEPASEGGRAARSRGWVVTGEAPLGPFTAVSFVGALEPATSGTCVLTEGNVGIFKGGELVALVYARRGSKQSIGKVTALEGGGVRVWGGDPPTLPIGDVQRAEGGYRLRLGALAPEETLCAGRAVVPNIYSLPIDRARAALASRGWAPVPTPREAGADRFGREMALARQGITEVEGCSGTGFGSCAFNYRGVGGRLSVTTMGEDDLPSVVGYGAACP